MAKTTITLVKKDGSSKVINFDDFITQKCLTSGRMYRGYVSGEKYLFKYDDSVHKISIDNTNNSDFLVEPKETGWWVCDLGGMDKLIADLSKSYLVSEASDNYLNPVSVIGSIIKADANSSGNPEWYVYNSQADAIKDFNDTGCLQFNKTKRPGYADSSWAEGKYWNQKTGWSTWPGKCYTYGCSGNKNGRNWKTDMKYMTSEFCKKKIQWHDTDQSTGRMNIILSTDDGCPDPSSFLTQGGCYSNCNVLRGQLADGGCPDSSICYKLKKDECETTTFNASEGAAWQKMRVEEDGDRPISSTTCIGMCRGGQQGQDNGDYAPGATACKWIEPAHGNYEITTLAETGPAKCTYFANKLCGSSGVSGDICKMYADCSQCWDPVKGTICCASGNAELGRKIEPLKCGTTELSWNDYIYYDCNKSTLATKKCPGLPTPRPRPPPTPIISKPTPKPAPKPTPVPAPTPIPKPTPVAPVDPGPDKGSPSNFKCDADVKMCIEARDGKQDWDGCFIENATATPKGPCINGQSYSCKLENLYKLIQWDRFTTPPNLIDLSIVIPDLSGYYNTMGQAVAAFHIDGCLKQYTTQTTPENAGGLPNSHFINGYTDMSWATHWKDIDPDKFHKNWPVICHKNKCTINKNNYLQMTWRPGMNYINSYACAQDKIWSSTIADRWPNKGNIIFSDQKCTPISTPTPAPATPTPAPATPTPAPATPTPAPATPTPAPATPTPAPATPTPAPATPTPALPALRSPLPSQCNGMLPGQPGTDTNNICHWCSSQTGQCTVDPTMNGKGTCELFSTGKWCAASPGPIPIPSPSP